MAANYNWRMIMGGEVFQSLINALLQFEYPRVQVFGRAGKDGALDGRSEDGEIIYQYKYHSDPSISKTVSDANNELAKIDIYKDKSHKNFALWKNVKEWVLVTNLRTNPNDVERWTVEIVPEFTKRGIKAVLWGLERLDALLTRHPYVGDAYFEGENRCFLSLGEAYEFVRQDEVAESGLDVLMVGREHQLSALSEYLKGNKKILCIEGPGGIGKTRLLLEAGGLAELNKFQVLWGVEATMSKSAQWFSALPCTAPSILLLDEPLDPALVRVVVEQLRMQNSRMLNWKVIITVRSPKDPILKVIATSSKSLKADPIILSPLSVEQAKLFALNLIRNSVLGARTEEEQIAIAKQLAKIGGQFPIWITIAMKALARTGSFSSLPISTDDIAIIYLDEVIEHCSSRVASQQQIQKLLRWLALFGEVNVEEASTFGFISKQSGFENESFTHECLASLVSRRFVVRRGIGNRLFSIKPDVMRDFVLRNWLINQHLGKPETSPAAAQLVKMIIDGVDQKPLPNLHSLIRSLARSEYASGPLGERIDFLSPLILELKNIARAGTLQESQSIISLLGALDFARIDGVIDIIQTIRLSPKSDVHFNDVFGQTKSLTHRNIVAQLAWPLFCAARYSETEFEIQAALKEMTSLFIMEFTPNLKVRSGYHAASLIPRMIAEENGFYVGFKNEAFKMAIDLIETLKRPEVLNITQLSLMALFCEAFLSVEKQQMFTKQHTVTYRKWLIRMQSEDGQKRVQIKISLRDCLSQHGIDASCRTQVLKLLAFAHTSGIRPSSQFENLDHKAELKADSMEDLEWILDLLNTQSLGLEELREARGFWDWHCRFDDDQDIKSMAERCEAFYQNDYRVNTFHNFFSQEAYEVVSKKAALVGKTLALKTSTEITEFLTNAEAFAPQGSEWSKVLWVAEEIASHWDTNPEIKAFVVECLKGDSAGLKFIFAAHTLNRTLKVFRDKNDLVRLDSTLQEMISVPTSISSQKMLMFVLLSRPHPLITGLLTEKDLQIICAKIAENSGCLDPQSTIQLLAGTYHTNWDVYRAHCDASFELSGRAERLGCFLSILDGMVFLDLFKDDYPVLRINATQYDWLLDKMVSLPDIDKIGDGHQFEMERFMLRFELKGLNWLLDTIYHRICLAETSNDEAELSHIIPITKRISKYVNKLSHGDEGSESIRLLVSSLVKYAKRNDIVGYIIPQYAIDLDPHGVLVPKLVQAEIAAETRKAKENIWIWSRFAGHYTFNSTPWKEIAKVAVTSVTDLPENERAAIFETLVSCEIQSSTYPAGEMDPEPERNLRKRKVELEQETDHELKAFREWHQAIAQSRYDFAVALHKEEREIDQDET